MQLLHLTYTWPGAPSDQVERQRLARQTWKVNSDPAQFKQLHFTEDDFLYKANMIGDRQPNVLLHHLLHTAFATTNDPLATIVLANSDIQLQIGHWEDARLRAISSTPSYDNAEHTRAPRPGDLDWLPRSFWIPQAWWTRTKQFIPPMFFPAAWWEDVLLRYIPDKDPEFGPVASSTAHEPHPMAIIPEHQRPPSVRFNFAIDTGWRHHHYHEPREIHGLRHKHDANPPNPQNSLA